MFRRSSVIETRSFRLCLPLWFVFLLLACLRKLPALDNSSHSPKVSKTLRLSRDKTLIACSRGPRRAFSGLLAYAGNLPRRQFISESLSRPTCIHEFSVQRKIGKSEFSHSPFSICCILSEYVKRTGDL